MSLNQQTIQSLILADDDEDDRYVFKDVINEVAPSIKVEAVANGLRLMELLQHFAPDLLFLEQIDINEVYMLL